MTKSIQELLLIDGNSIICRYFYGVPSRLTSDSLEVNALYCFTRFLINLIKRNINKYFSIIVLFDRTSNNFRKEILKSYKQNRPRPSENFFQQINLCEEVCDLLNVAVDYHKVYEADDLIASYKKLFHKHYKNSKVTIISTDKDLMQLVEDNVFFLNIFSKKFFNKTDVFEKMGVYPKQIADFLAICGDSSDNIPGIYKIGEKTAAKLLSKYEKLENIINSEEGKKKDFTPAILFKKLTTLKDDIQLNIEKFYKPNPKKEKFKNFLEQYNFIDLLDIF
ncbi:hypothetical protein AB836_00520 [Rickettsiales bacterium (ex Bugula neritina AB1)]|nr:hypothetical protein AB836_00520 [Rickettsiales bacterium (ex Bugula neritina AB1)]